jgi:hypothetical protein
MHTNALNTIMSPSYPMPTFLSIAKIFHYPIIPNGLHGNGSICYNFGMAIANHTGNSLAAVGSGDQRSWMFCV